MTNDFDDIDLPLEAVFSQRMMATLSEVSDRPPAASMQEAIAKIMDCVGATAMAVVQLELLVRGLPDQQ